MVAFFRANQLSLVFTFLAIRFACVQSAVHQDFEHLDTLLSVAFTNHALATMPAMAVTTMPTAASPDGGVSAAMPSAIRRRNSSSSSEPSLMLSFAFPKSKSRGIVVSNGRWSLGPQKPMSTDDSVSPNGRKTRSITDGLPLSFAGKWVGPLRGPNLTSRPSFNTSASNQFAKVEGFPRRVKSQRGEWQLKSPPMYPSLGSSRPGLSRNLMAVPFEPE